MPRVRFGLKWAVVLVALAALVAFGMEMRRRRTEFLRRAGWAEIQVGFCHRSAAIDRSMAAAARKGLVRGDEEDADDKKTPPTEETRERQVQHYLMRAESNMREAERSQQIVEKYKHAARYPWLPVPPDPPEPE